MCLDSTRKTASTDVWKRAVTTCGKPHTLLSSLQWQDGKPSTAFWERAVTTCRKPNQLLSETAVTTYGIHPVPTKCALKAHEKLHPLIFEREQWQHVENPIYCLVHNSENIWNIFHCLLSVQRKHAENQIHCFLREGSDNMWKATHTA